MTGDHPAFKHKNILATQFSSFAKPSTNPSKTPFLPKMIHKSFKSQTKLPMHTMVLSPKNEKLEQEDQSFQRMLNHGNYNSMEILTSFGLVTKAYLHR